MSAWQNNFQSPVFILQYDADEKAAAATSCILTAVWQEKQQRRQRQSLFMSSADSENITLFLISRKSIVGV